MTKENDEYQLFVGSLNFISRLKPKAAPKSENIVIGQAIPIFKADAPKAVVIKVDPKKTDKQ